MIRARCVCTTLNAVVLAVLAAVPSAGADEALPPRWDDAYSAGRSSVAEDPGAAVKYCRAAVVEPAIRDWAELCIAEALLEQGKRSLSTRELTRISRSSAAILHAKALELEIAPINQRWRREFEDLQQRAAPLNIAELGPPLTFLRAREAAAARDRKRTLELLQTARAALPPRAALRRRIRDYQTQFMPFPGSRKPARLEGVDLEPFWLREVSLLTAEQLPDRALTIVQQRLKSLSPAERPREYFALLQSKWRLFEAGGKVQAIVREKEQIKKDGPTALRELLIADETAGSWRRRDYALTRSLLPALPEEHPVRVFIDANLAELGGERAAAIAGYRRAFGMPSEYQRVAGLRLLWLLLAQEEWQEAFQIGRTLQQRSGLAWLDAEAVAFWTKRAAAAAGIPGTFREPEALTYYYWLERGLSFEDHTAPRAAVAAASCRASLPVEEPPVAQEVQVLAEHGFHALAAQELRFRSALPHDPPGWVLRARLLARYASPAAAWSEVRAHFSLPEAYAGDCGQELLTLMYPTPFLDLFERAATLEKVPLALVLGLARTESSFDPAVVSYAGAAGLMQLMPATARSEGYTGTDALQDLKSPELNVMLGVKHVARLLEQFEGRRPLAIAAYNAGGQAVRRWLAVHPNVDPLLWIETIPYKETRDYVKKVLAAYAVYTWRLHDA